MSLLTVLRLTVLLLAVLAASRLMRRQSAARRRCLWATAFFVALLLPFLPGLLPWHWEPGITMPALPGVTAMADPGAGVPGTGSDVVALGSDGGVVGSPPMGAEIRPAAVDTLVRVWLAGMALVLTGLLVGVLRARNWRRHARPPAGGHLSAIIGAEGRAGNHPVLVTDALDSPVTVGVARPVILLPTAAESWSRERVEAVLLHEEAHIVQRDVPLQLMARLACALYWFHPLVWVGWRRLRRESERACDDAVLRGGLRPSDYAGHLLELVVAGTPLRGPAAAVSMARPGEFEGRLLDILDGERDRRGPGRSYIAAILTTALFVGLALSGVAPVAEAGAPDLTEETLLAASASPLHSLAGGSGSEVATALAGLLADPDPGVRAAAARALGDRRDGAGSSLLTALDDAEPRVRREVAVALGKIREPQGVAPLARAALHDPDKDVRKAATWALGSTGHPAAVPALLEVMETAGAERMRLLAVRALGELRSPASVAALEPLVQSPDRRVRREAVEALAEVGGEQAQAVLVRALGSPHADIRSLAARGLGEGGR